MAWFDILGGAMEGAQQGIANAQQLFLTRQELQERQRRAAEEQRRFTLAEQRATAEEKRREQEFTAGLQDRAAADVQRVLAGENPDQLDPALIQQLAQQSPQHARAVQTAVTRGQDGAYQLRETPEQRRQRKIRGEELALREAELPDLLGQAQEQQAARAAMRDSAFRGQPYEDRVRTMAQAGLSPDQIFARLSGPEKKRYLAEGPTPEMAQRFQLTQLEIAARQRSDALNRAADKAQLDAQQRQFLQRYMLDLAKLNQDATEMELRQQAQVAASVISANRDADPAQVSTLIDSALEGLYQYQQKRRGGKTPAPPPTQNTPPVAGNPTRGGAFTGFPEYD